MNKKTSEDINYEKDKRTACKFGVKCYQKNQLHHEKYKHPPKMRATIKDHEREPLPKKLKIDGDDLVSSSTTNNSELIDESKESDFQDYTSEINVGEDKFNTKIAIGNGNGSDDVATKLETMEDKKRFIKEKFLVEMPEDFYTFWEFCQCLDKKNPCQAFNGANLSLVGPYDVLADKFTNTIEKPSEEYLIHWRYYYDPPEFQTVIKRNDASGYHIGYFRDDPSDLPVFLGCNYASQDGTISVMGDNIFAAVYLYLEEAMKMYSPFQKMTCSKLQAAIKARAAKLGLNVTEKSEKIKTRDKQILVRTFNKAGLVVPYNKKTRLGYRHLYVNDKELKKLLDSVMHASDQQKDRAMSELQPVLTATDIAIDECDFGTGIELGLNILAHGVESLNATILRFLCTGYNLVQRSEFAQIANAHMKNRKRQTSLSII